MVKKNEVKRSYFLNLFSANAEITDNANEFPNTTIITGYTSLIGGSNYIYPPSLSVSGSCPNFAGTTVLTPTSVSSTNYIINNKGSGYANGDTIVFNNTGTGGGSGVSATVIITSGLITNYSGLVAGSGYVNAPSLSATGGGSGFIGSTLLTPTTVSTTFNIINGGTGYITGDILVFDNTGTGGTGVSATVITSSGVITGITLTNAGSGYNIKAPLVSNVSSVNGTGANITCSLVASSVASIIITSSGTGYSTSPTFVFTPIGAGSGASATPTITNGCITGLTFTNQGSGYTLQAPTVSSITTASGTGASITFYLNPTSVASLNITNGGLGSTSKFLSFVITPNNTLGLGLGSGCSVIPITKLKNKMFKWNIRDLQLGSVAEISLIQIVHINAVSNATYAIRCLETYADGFDSYNHTSAIVYLGLGLNTPSITTYHKLLSQNLNSITLILTDDLTSSSNVSAGISKTITFSAIFEVVDYIDDNQTY